MTDTTISRGARGPYAKSEVTARMIVDHARELFIRRGFGAVSLRDIASSCGLSHPALRRYFASTGEILDHIVREYEQRNRLWITLRSSTGDSLDLAVDLARHNSEQPGYVELFTALSGVAVAKDHPAHDRLIARYRAVREASLEALGPDRIDTAVLAAISDGLQLASLFDEGIDVAEEMGEYVRWWRAGGIARRPATTSFQSIDLPFLGERDTRAKVLREAAHSFARQGFHASSLDSIARAAGVSKSTLLHHVSNKVELLTLVLGHLDDAFSGPSVPNAGSPDGLQDFIGRVIPNEATPLISLVEAYVVLLSEGASTEHPAHSWITDRIMRRKTALTEQFAALGADERRTPHPSRSALWTVAVRDGLRLQWLYDREVPAQRALQAFTGTIAPRMDPSPPVP